MHKIEIQEVWIDGKKVPVDINPFLSVIKIDLSKNELHSDAYYCKEREIKGFFDAFKEGTRVKIIEGKVKFSDWEIKYSVPEDQAANSIRKMGISGAIGFTIAGPLGAAAGALMTNRKDILVILSKGNTVINGKTSAGFIEALKEMEFFKNKS